MLPDAALSPLAHAFPNMLAWADAPWLTVALLLLGALAGALLTVGRWPRVSALVSYYVWACAFVAIRSSSTQACPTSASCRRPPSCSMDVELARRLLWLASARRSTATAVSHAPMHALLAAPTWVNASLTFAVVTLELAFLPLSLVQKLRPLLWLAMLALHLGLLAPMRFPDLSLGMVVLHLFTFDSGWLRARATASTRQRVVCAAIHRQGVART